MKEEKRRKNDFFFSLQSDSESSSCGDDESHADDAIRPSAIPHQLSNEFDRKTLIWIFEDFFNF